MTLGVEQIASGYAPLTFITHAGDGSGRLFLVEQRGRIIILDSMGRETAQFLDISERMKSGGEQGLLGLAFHPDFESNGRFFVNYTDNRGDTVVSEFGLGPDGLGDPATERLVIGFDQPYVNHNGGMLAFAPDGYLYIGTGDGGPLSGGDPNGNGQRLDTLLGKILRIDVDSGDPYTVPADNPFADGADGLPEIWSYGLRNPWRFSFDRVTGGLFIGDVGQGELEEVNVEPPGESGRNYGWNIMEGDRCFVRDNCDRQGLAMPAVTYGRDGGQCAITGGYVYRGNQAALLYGGYVFADYCSGMMWAFAAESALATGQAPLIQVGVSGTNPTSFGEDEAGELYVVSRGGGVFRLVATDR